MNWKTIHSLARALTRVTTVVTALVWASLVYAIMHWSSPPPLWRAEKSESPTILRTLLFKDEQQIDLYRIIKSKDSYQIFSFTGAVLPSEDPNPMRDVYARILGEMSTLIDSGISAPRIAWLSATKELVVPLVPQRLIHGLQDHSKQFYSATEDDAVVLYIHSPACATDRRIVMDTVHDDMAETIAKISVPAQRKLELSPFQNTLAFLDHANAPRITLLNLITEQTTPLRAPTFGEEQLHFSPMFYDEDTLLFSVIDGNRWGTVLYDISRREYTPFSVHFTDRALRAASGSGIVLQQSFYGGTVNIPFGSLALRDQNEDFLSLSTIIQRQSGTIRIFKATLDGAQTGAGSQTFRASPEKGYFEYTERVDPLLTALDLPSNLIREYERRGKEAEARGESYVLVDAYWR
jgi:hypothetical protein